METVTQKMLDIPDTLSEHDGEVDDDYDCQNITDTIGCNIQLCQKSNHHQFLENPIALNKDVHLVLE